VSRENHQDGGEHYHVVLHYNRRRDLRDARKTYTPPRSGGIHVEVARSLNRVVEYCKKDGDFLEVGTEHIKADKETTSKLLADWLGHEKLQPGQTSTV